MKATRRKRSNQINIVPLVDVLIVLIFFFLMSMQFSNLPVLQITPPKLDTAGQENAAASVEIAVSEQGDYFVNAEPATSEQVIEFIQSIAGVADKPRMLILADENSPLKAVTFLLDTARREGVDQISLRAR